MPKELNDFSDQVLLHWFPTGKSSRKCGVILTRYSHIGNVENIGLNVRNIKECSVEYCQSYITLLWI